MYEIEFKGKHVGLSVNNDVYTADVYREKHLATNVLYTYEEYSEAILKALNDREAEIYFSGTQFIDAGSMRAIPLNKYVLIQEYNLQHNYYWYKVIETEDNYPQLEVKNNCFLIKNSRRYPIRSTEPLYSFRRAVAIARRVINDEIFSEDLVNYMKIFFEKKIQYDLYGNYILDTPFEYTDSRSLINSVIKNFGINELFYT